VFEHVARIGFAVDDDQVGLQLGHALGQEDIRRQRSDDVVARFQQADAQRRVALELASAASSWPDASAVTTTMRRLRGGWLDFMHASMQEAGHALYG